MRMRVTVAAVAALVAFSGCAAKVVSSSARTVVISAGDARVQEAQSLADTECARHSRNARMIARPNPNSDQFVFDCVQ